MFICYDSSITPSSGFNLNNELPLHNKYTNIYNNNGGGRMSNVAKNFVSLIPNSLFSPSFHLSTYFLKLDCNFDFFMPKIGADRGSGSNFVLTVINQQVISAVVVHNCDILVLDLATGKLNICSCRLAAPKL